jgi:hypothetical protein
MADKKGTPEMKEHNTMMRQGDVLVIPIKRMPRNLVAVPRENGRVVLAHGEVTGHAHAIKSERAALFRDPKLAAIFMHVTEPFMQADDPVALEHDEHDTITIPPGSYRVVRQREYSPQEIKNVAD